MMNKPVLSFINLNIRSKMFTANWAIILFLITHIPNNVQSTCSTQPINCDVIYGDWSDCDPCTFTKSRHINIKRATETGGLPCPDDLTESQSCVTPDLCNFNVVVCSKYQFKCVQTIRCIDDFLVCNGEDDCGDNSDERNCTIFHNRSPSVKQCTNMPAIPYSELVSSGYNQLTQTFRSKVFDNSRYDGLCRYAQDGDTGTTYRLPYNFGSFLFQVIADGQSHASIYNSFADFTTTHTSSSSDKNMNSQSHGGRFFAESSSSINYQSSTYKTLHKSSTQESSKIYLVGTSVQLGQFVMRDQQLILDPFFVQSVSRLPIKYNAGAYFDFINMYGTHYVEAGTLGGTYTYYYTFYESSSSTYNYNEKDVSSYYSAQYNNKVFRNQWSSSNSYGNADYDTSTFLQGMGQATYDTLVVVNGGTSKAVGDFTLPSLSFNSSNLTIQSPYTIWMESLKYNPAVLDKELVPICDLIKFTYLQNVDQITKLCMETLTTYYQQFSTNSCIPCENGGILINVAKSCYCTCQASYTGSHCAIKIKNSTDELSTSVLADDLKFIKTTIDNKTAAEDPVALVEKTLGAFDNIIKTKGNVLFYLSSDTGRRYKNSGNFTIKAVNDLLNNERDKIIDFSYITSPAGTLDCNTRVCEIVDFDLDNSGNIILSIKNTDFTTNPNIISGYVYKIAPNGTEIFSISNPCSITGNIYPQAFVTVDCQDTLIVGCYANPATLRVYSTNGLPNQVIQFADLSAVNSMTISKVDSTLWLHTITGQLASYDMLTWQRKVLVQSPLTNSSNHNSYTQIDIDFMGNVLIGQAETTDNVPRFIFFDPVANAVVIEIYLSDLYNCQWISSYKGRVYVICNEKSSSTVRSLTVFDYLK